MDSINWGKISEQLIIFAVGGGISWLFSKVLKLSKDMNSAFFKLRNLEREVLKDERKDRN